MALALSRSTVSRAQARRLRLAFFVLVYTGQAYTVPHPYLRDSRLRWTSNAVRGTIPALS